MVQGLLQGKVGQENLMRIDQERMAGSLLAHFSSLAKIDSIDVTQKKKFSDYLLSLGSIRALSQDDLKNIFLLLPTIQSCMSTLQFNHLLMNVGSNLSTISTDLIYTLDGSEAFLDANRELDYEDN